MNRLLAYAGEALDALWRNRVRSILTMLGMIIGTSSVIGVLAISGAASGGITSSLRAFGDPGLVVQVDTRQDDPSAAAIQFRDVATLRGALGDRVGRIIPQYQRNFWVAANGKRVVSIVVSQEAVHSDTLSLAAGRRIDRDDVEGAAKVTLMSQSLAHKLFPDRAALGEVVTINGSRFRIVGVYDDLKAGIFTNVAGSDYAEIPYTAFRAMIPGPVDSLTIYPPRGQSVATSTDLITSALRRLHGPRATYDVQDAAAFVTGFERVIGVVAIGLTAIGGVALVVAGIGIMNIMLVSVTERTREIGIRKAIGASARDITLQFLMEALILSLAGGAIGLAIGLGLTFAVSGIVAAQVGPAPIPLGEIVAVAVGFSSLVGIVFGTYPAIRAGRLEPIAALRGAAS